MPLETLSAGLIAWLVLVIAFAGVTQGALGFGFPFIATPLIAMTSDMRTAVITVLLPTLAVVVAGLARSGPLRPVLARFWMMPLYALAGALAGTWLFVAFPRVPYALLLALVTLVYLQLDRLGAGRLSCVQRHERAFAPLFGLSAGAFEGTANVAAPPLIMYYLSLGLAPAAFAQGLNICFFVGKSMQFSVLATRGGVTVADWAATLPLVAVAIGAFFIGLTIRHRIDALTFRTWVKRMLFLTAVVLLAQFAWTALA
jgi:uncharacterized protein